MPLVDEATAALTDQDTAILKDYGAGPGDLLGVGGQARVDRLVLSEIRYPPIVYCVAAYCHRLTGLKGASFAI